MFYNKGAKRIVEVPDLWRIRPIIPPNQKHLKKATGSEKKHCETKRSNSGTRYSEINTFQNNEVNLGNFAKCSNINPPNKADSEKSNNEKVEHSDLSKAKVVN